MGDGFVMVSAIHRRIRLNREPGFDLYGLLWTVVDAGKTGITLDIPLPPRLLIDYLNPFIQTDLFTDATAIA